MPECPPLVLLDAFGGRDFDRSWRFGDYRETIVALTPDEVPAVLARVEEAAASGLHAAGFVAFDAAHGLNRSLLSLPAMDGLPLAWFALYCERHQATPGEGLPPPDGGAALDLQPGVTPERYRQDVGRIRSLISSGDCYQVNHTFPLAGRYDGDPLRLYRRMGEGQQASFCAFLDTGRFTILSASPELFFSLRNGTITVRPMKGTALRGRWLEEDREAARRLSENVKERAENLMIVDLLRNDLGVVAETGSVKVEELFAVEMYPTVHQLTSTVSARLRPGISFPEIFTALFPCGSVTGAPKRRTMEIIAEIEGRPRGVYCGAIGYVAPNGEALFSVAIRTLVIDREAETAVLGVGSGITWDADPAAEYAECLAKGTFVGYRRERFRLIESLRLEEGSYPLLERHLDRLAASADYFGFPCDLAVVRRLLAECAAEFAGLRKVRLLLADDGALTLSSEPIMPDDPGRPLRLAVAPERVDENDCFRFHKTTRRELLDGARENRPDCDEVLFRNGRGELTEGSYHTLVLRLDGRLVTPALSCGLLPGVMRAKLLARGEVEEAILFPDDLLKAEEIWLVNAVRGWRRGVLIDAVGTGSSPCPEYTQNKGSKR